MDQINYVGPLAPIIGAVIGALITGGFGYYKIAKRKSLRFLVTHTEDLTRTLRDAREQIAVTVGGLGFFNFNRAIVTVKNTGNTSIDNFQFDIHIPGEHRACVADAICGDPELRKSITIEMDQPAQTHNPTLHVRVASFLNEGDSFKVAVFFDDEVTDVVIRCRVMDVKSKVKWNEPVGFLDIQRGDSLNWLTLVTAGIVAQFAFTIGLIMLALLTKYLAIDLLKTLTGN